MWRKKLFWEELIANFTAVQLQQRQSVPGQDYLTTKEAQSWSGAQMNICYKIIPFSSICTYFTPLSNNKEGLLATTVNRFWTIQGPAHVTNLVKVKRFCGETLLLLWASWEKPGAGAFYNLVRCHRVDRSNWLDYSFLKTKE